MMPDIDPTATPLLKALRPIIERDLTRIRAHRAHLFGRIHPPDALLPDERWEVNLEEPSFTIRWGEEIVTRCEAQLVGTWSRRDGSFLWGHANPSIAAAATQRLAAWAELADVTALAACKRFTVDEQTAVDLAGLLAMRAGWLGPYPGGTGDVIALLVVKPLPDATAKAPGAWCTFCGRHQVGRLMAASPCCICDGKSCAGHFGNMADELDDATSDTSVAPGLGCAFCSREDTRVIQHCYTGMCVECIRLVQDVFGLKGAAPAPAE